ncbi:hypothetical protein [Vibrio anguillarum]|uniref:hypothetical protein n=1 Tax=Vibrio anguillarum TaxID=55601 RepID=UPI0018C2DC13|nr:hypothetical protein [Vibrio anguillarum]
MASQLPTANKTPANGRVQKQKKPPGGSFGIVGTIYRKLIENSTLEDGKLNLAEVP